MYINNRCRRDENVRRSRLTGCGLRDYLDSSCARQTRYTIIASSKIDDSLISLAFLAHNFSAKDPQITIGILRSIFSLFFWRVDFCSCFHFTRKVIKRANSWTDGALCVMISYHNWIPSGCNWDNWKVFSYILCNVAVDLDPQKPKGSALFLIKCVPTDISFHMALFHAMTHDRPTRRPWHFTILPLSASVWLKKERWGKDRISNNSLYLHRQVC